MKKVYIVEYRQVDLTVNDNEIIECFSSFVASTKDKALLFCRSNTNYNEHNKSKPWWFAVYEEEVDNSDENASKLICFVDWYGNELLDQPVNGYYDNVFFITRSGPVKKHKI